MVHQCYLGCVSGGGRCAYMHVLVRTNIFFADVLVRKSFLVLKKKIRPEEGP